MRKLWTEIRKNIPVISLILAFIMLFITCQGRFERTKDIEIVKIAQATLVNEKFHAKQRIAIMYDGKPITNYVIVHIRVTNTGGQPINPSDYNKPLQFDFGNTAKILSAEQVSSYPKDIQIKTTVGGENGNFVELSSELLNSKYWYTLEIGVAPKSGEEPKVDLKGMIVGISDLRIKDFTSQPTNEKSQIWYTWLVIAVGVILIATGTLTIIPQMTRFYRRYVKRKKIYDDIRQFLTVCSLENRSVTAARRTLLTFYEIDDDVSEYAKSYIAKIVKNEEELGIAKSAHDEAKQRELRAWFGKELKNLDAKLRRKVLKNDE